MIETIRKHGGILAVAALLSTALVAVTNALTEDTIKEQQQIQLSKALNQVIPKARHDNALHRSCRLVTNSDALGTDEAQPFLCRDPKRRSHYRRHSNHRPQWLQWCH